MRLHFSPAYVLQLQSTDAGGTALHSILYDRLATTSEPTNPYALKSHHLAPLPAASASQPGSALTHPDYALAAPEPVFADAVLAMQRAAAGAAERTRDGASGGAIPGTAGPGTNWGDRPVIGVAGEHEPELLAGAAARAAALQAGIGPKASALSSQAPPQQNAYASTSSSVPQQQHVQLPSALPQMPAHDMSMLPHAPPSASAYGTMNGGAGDSYALPHASSSAASPNAAAAAAAALSAASELPTVNGERMDVEAQ